MGSLVGTGVVVAAEGLVFGFDLVFDRWARHQSIEFLHGSGDSGGKTAAAASVAALAAEIRDRGPNER